MPLVSLLFSPLVLKLVHLTLVVLHVGKGNILEGEPCLGERKIFAFLHLVLQVGWQIAPTGLVGLVGALLLC